MHIAAASRSKPRLMPAVQKSATLWRKAKEFADIVKIGRTHLQDATPLTVGQEFSGWVALLDRDWRARGRALDGLYDLAIGGTAVGTGLNAHPEFAERAARKNRRADRTAVPIASQQVRRALRARRTRLRQRRVENSGASLMKIANDIRWLASGPRCGLGELILPGKRAGLLDHARQSQSDAVRSDDDGRRAGDGQRRRDRLRRLAGKFRAQRFQAGDDPQLSPLR